MWTLLHLFLLNSLPMKMLAVLQPLFYLIFNLLPLLLNVVIRTIFTLVSKHHLLLNITMPFSPFPQTTVLLLTSIMTPSTNPFLLLSPTIVEIIRPALLLHKIIFIVLFQLNIQFVFVIIVKIVSTMVHISFIDLPFLHLLNIVALVELHFLFFPGLLHFFPWLVNFLSLFLHFLLHIISIE